MIKTIKTNIPNNNPAKPIIYLYPESELEVSVRLGAPERITSSYPKYTNGWDVVAYPNGDLIDKTDGTKLYALYWEGINYDANYGFATGFIIKSEDVIAFLEDKLEILGLNYKEREEFIVYGYQNLKPINIITSILQPTKKLNKKCH